MNEKAKLLGKQFATLVDIEYHKNRDKWVGSVCIGDNYFETDRYDKKEYAISELLGYLEGIDVQVQAHIEYLKKEIDKEI